MSVSTFFVAQADAAAVATAFPIGPVKLIFVLAWVYLCLYLVQRLEESPLVPGKYRSLLLVLSLFFGPFVFLGVVLLDTKNTGRSGDPLVEFLQRIRDSLLGTLRSGGEEEVEEVELRLFDSTGAELSEIYGHGKGRAADRTTFELTVKLIDDALKQRASDILIDPKDDTSYSVRLRIDGTLRVVSQLPVDICRAVINSVKAVSSMDISERRRPQDGAFTAKRGEQTISFRVASAGALNGEKLSIRALNQNAGRFTLSDVGMPESQQAAVVEAIRKPSGMALVCGPTGSGKTTTLYSMLNYIDRETHNVITVEDPIEAYLPEASQIEINAKAGITFAKALRSILRQDPDVICVGEIRDEETAEIALRAAQTGHLVLATIHCDSNATALLRLLDLGVSPMLLSAGLNLLLSQRLIRRLCDDCKKPANLPPALLQKFLKLGVDPANVFEAVGCEKCGGVGYYGRMAICDILRITDDLRAEIATDGAIANKLKTESDTKDRANLKNEAFRKVIAGLTSIEEVKRVVG